MSILDGTTHTKPGPTTIKYADILRLVAACKRSYRSSIPLDEWLGRPATIEEKFTMVRLNSVARFGTAFVRLETV